MKCCICVLLIYYSLLSSVMVVTNFHFDLQLINGQKSEPTLEFGGSMLQSVHVNGSVNPSGSKAQNEKLLMMPFQNQISGATQSERFLVSGHPTTSLQVPLTSSNGLGHEAHLAHPGLNTNPVEFTQINSSQSQPLDEATANRELNRALAAEARRRRILIFRLKYSQKSRNDYRWQHRLILPFILLEF